MQPNTRPVLILATLLIAVVTGCAHEYVPEEYVIEEGRIEPFAVAGNVSAPIADDEIRDLRVQAGIHHWDFNNQTVAQAVSTQLMDEVGKNGQRRGEGDDKTLEISVQSMVVGQGAFTFNGTLVMSVTLGDGTTIPFTVKNNSPGNIWRTLNGTVATAVMEILANPVVLAYLGS